MVIIQVPYTLCYKEEARIYRKLTSSTQAFREVHLDPHALHIAAAFAVLTRMQEGDDHEAENVKKTRLYAGEDVEGMAQSEIEKIRARAPEEGLAGVSPRFEVLEYVRRVWRRPVRLRTVNERRETIELAA